MSWLKLRYNYAAYIIQTLTVVVAPARARAHGQKVRNNRIRRNPQPRRRTEERPSMISRR